MNRTAPGSGAAVAATLLFALAGLGAALPPSTAEAQETVAAGRSIAPDASIKVWNGGGELRVEGWDADSLAVTGEVAGAAGGRFFLRAEGDAAKLGVEGDQAEVRGRLVVRVPRGATVWIRTTSADVVVRELTGRVDVHTVAGGVDVRGRPETLYAESMSGEVELDLEGRIVRARSGTGGIRFRGSADDLTLDAVDGRLRVAATGLRRGRFTTVGGAIDFTGGVRRAGALTFETHAGDVRLELPAGLAADFRLSTFEGRIDAGYDGAPETDDGPGRRSVRFETGDGGSEVEVRSFSGSVTVVPGGR
mgnify:CR=1 FL=1